MSELVHEYVFGEAGVDRGRGLIAKDSAAAVLLLVDEDLEVIVRRRRRDLAQRMVVERQHVTLRIEDVVFDAGQRAAIVLRARTMNAALRRRQIERANVEVLLPALER